ncbi:MULTISPECIES: glutathione S-transferase [Actibacterium]|uniref:Glutathione S-transferase n=1 Tax=Actibacterium naphthalenivorans TaxID=1614693 RepID=A0A840C9K1_9RHOB|nr:MULTISPECIES: glutathione S-transferase [Actibacterium]ALG91610.1 glutathione S-transferase [Actibacterium sp. EMB200-NS6]MBB4021760.1 glutathione S-transferase [Actibacterium naphthalenivorans]
MQLFHSPTSPFVRKVMVVLHETGQLPAVELLPASGHPLASQNMPTAHNPLGKVPTLLRDDGPAIYDSRVICRFLDARADGTLYPEAGIWESLTLEATADGIMDAAVLMMYEIRCRPEEMRVEDWGEAQWQKIVRALDALETHWMDHLATARLDIGQIATGCALAYLDFRLGNRDWRGDRPALAGWCAEFTQRPSMQATIPVG